jgi:ABC-type uncharacterized transport system permease subunit
VPASPPVEGKVISSVEQASVLLFWFALALYVGATVLYAYQFILKRAKVAWWARFLTGSGFILQTLSIGAHSIVSHGTKFTGQNQLILASWALVLMYFVMEHVIRIKIYGAFLIPVAMILMAIAQVIGRTGAGTSLTPVQLGQLDDWRIAFHVALVVFGNAGFAFGSVSSALYLIQGAQLKRHKSSRFGRRLPSLATLQQVARRSISLAYPIYSAGLAMGVLRAIEVDVAGWWQDARVMSAGVVWLVYGVYLILVYRHDVSGKKTAWVSLAGFVLVIAVGILARTLPVGFHVFGLS